MTSLENPQNAAVGKREPIFNIPWVVVALVGALLMGQAVLYFASADAAGAIIDTLGFHPALATYAAIPEHLFNICRRLESVPTDLFARGQLQGIHELDPNFQFPLCAKIAILDARPWTLLTYAFLHDPNSWTHVGLNAVWIVAFGPPVAHRVGALRFLALFCVTAIAGALAHYALNPMDFTPLIGASAADSGLMAAAARFMFQPGAPLGAPAGYSSSAAPPRFNAPAPGMRALLRDRRAVIFIAIWLATNFIFGAGAESFGLADGPVAWVAHVGGFAAGFFLFPWFDRRTAGTGAG